jgi:hypothetical protein
MSRPIRQGTQHAGAPADHITPYDRMALDEATLVALLARARRTKDWSNISAPSCTPSSRSSRARSRAGLRSEPHRGAACTSCPASWVRSLASSAAAKRPNDILWLDPIDIAFGRLTELKLNGESRIVPLGAMNYTYLKITLSLRKAGFDSRAARLRLATRHRPRSANYSPTGSTPTGATTWR